MRSVETIAVQRADEQLERDPFPFDPGCHGTGQPKAPGPRERVVAVLARLHPDSMRRLDDLCECTRVRRSDYLREAVDMLLAHYEGASMPVPKRKSSPLHLTYADAVAAGEMRPPRTEVEHLIYGVRPITSEDPSPCTLQTILRVTEQHETVIEKHRYLPRAPKGTRPEVARAFHAWADEKIPWVPGPPPFVKAAMASSQDGNAAAKEEP